MQKIKDIVIKHKTIILYSIFGGLTTIVNYIVYFALFYTAQFTALTSNIMAWAVAVLFAFFTNKPLVFKSHEWSAHVILKELLGFVGCRALTGALETAFLYVLVDTLLLNALVWKLVISIAVVILNYIGSRFTFLKK